MYQFYYDDSFITIIHFTYVQYNQLKPYETKILFQAND